MNAIGLISLSFKHQTKLALRKLFKAMNIRLLFSGEQNINYLREYLNEFYLRQCNGILHIGAHAAEEAQIYEDLGKKVLWIEGDPEVFSKLRLNIENFPRQEAICALLSDKNGSAEFYVTDNHGFSSSLHPLTEKGHDWTLKVVSVKNLETSRFDDLDISNLHDYDFWVIDVQGHEFEVLNGALNSLSVAKWLLVEISTRQFYEGQKVFSEVDALLQSIGFVRLHDPLDEHSEVLYMRSPSLIS